MPSPVYKFLVFLAMVIPVNCFAQFTISGRVLNQADSKPVANASVFINNATIGSATSAKGTFDLYNVKPGKYYVIVTIIGFETYSQEVTIADHNITMPDIILTPKITELKEVVIKVNHNRDKYFNMYYGLFKSEFLGTSTIASDCTILNPEILDFDYNDETDMLTVSSDDFLQIENPDLGYKVKYMLQN